MKKVFKKVCCVSQHSRKSVEIAGDQSLHQESWTGPLKGILPAAGQHLLLWTRRNLRNTDRALQNDLQQAWTCFWPNCQKQNKGGWHEGLTSSSGSAWLAFARSLQCYKISNVIHFILPLNSTRSMLGWCLIHHGTGAYRSYCGLCVYFQRLPSTCISYGRFWTSRAAMDQHFCWMLEYGMSIMLNSAHCR